MLKTLQEAHRTKSLVNMEKWVVTDKTKSLVHAVVGVRSGWRHEKDGKRG
jgi:hypothetical protein